MKSELDWLCRELLASPYCYALCLDEKAFAAEQKRLKIPKRNRSDFSKTESCGATVHYFAKGDGIEKCAIVTMRRKKGVALEQVYGLLVHEAVHIWRAIREDLGEKHPASEQEAYAIQRIAQSLMTSYKEQTKK